MMENTITRFKLGDFKGGWFIGDFEPSLHRTKEFEVSVKVHPKGEVWEKHYHAIAFEYNCVVSGKVEIDGVVYQKDDIFVIPPMYVVDPTFLEDCTIVCVKTPSVIGDKFEVQR